MDTQELKQAMREDIETLKSCDLEIMPAQDYYRANLGLFKTVFLRMYFTVVLAAMTSILLHWSSFFLNREDGLNHSLLTFGGGFMLTGFLFLFIQDSLNNYVIFYHQIRLRLKSGELIDKQIKRAGWLAYKIFAFVVLVPALFFQPLYVLIAEFIAFFVSSIMTGIMIEMEMKRVGLSALFTLINDYFDKSKNGFQNPKGI